MQRTVIDKIECLMLLVSEFVSHNNEVFSDKRVGEVSIRIADLCDFAQGWKTRYQMTASAYMFRVVKQDLIFGFLRQKRLQSSAKSVQCSLGMVFVKWGVNSGLTSIGLLFVNFNNLSISTYASDQQDIVTIRRNNLLQCYSCYSSFYTYQTSIIIYLCI